MTLPYQKSSSNRPILTPLELVDSGVAFPVRCGLLGHGYHGEAVRNTLAEAQSLDAKLTTGEILEWLRRGVLEQVGR
jgi:hypothetical protein